MCFRGGVGVVFKKVCVEKFFHEIFGIVSNWTIVIICFFLDIVCTFALLLFNYYLI